MKIATTAIGASDLTWSIPHRLGVHIQRQNTLLLATVRLRTLGVCCVGGACTCARAFRSRRCLPSSSRALLAASLSRVDVLSSHCRSSLTRFLRTENAAHNAHTVVSGELRQAPTIACDLPISVGLAGSDRKFGVDGPRTLQTANK